MRAIQFFFLAATFFFSCNNKDIPNLQLNILLITADDHGVQLGCYGDLVARTPNLDRLASEGVMFNHAYVTQASCSPSRSSILTGMFPHQTGQIGLAHRGFSMKEGFPNIVDLLKHQGYTTGIIGKLHVNPEEEFPFDFALTMAGPTRNVRWVADTAKAFLQATEGPFLLYVNYSDPHVPFTAKVQGIPQNPFDSTMVKPFPWQGIDDPEELARIAGYYNGVARLDVGVGMLLDVIDELGHEDNTLVMYLGDHGAPFTRGKTSCYESGVQIPFIIKYPGSIDGSSRSDALISTVDIVPTILDALNIEAAFPGQSLLETIDVSSGHRRDYLFTEFTYHTHRNYAPKRAVRDQRFKLIHNLLPGELAKPSVSVDGDMAFRLSCESKYNDTKVREAFDRLVDPPEFELYDLQSDPYEFANLADNPVYASELDRLRSVLFNWRQETNDPFLSDSLLYHHLTLVNINSTEK